jgi:two-component system NtrC family sensor kinase
MSETVKILCVDDEPNVLKSLNRLFMDEDYEIFSADSGEQGLSVLAEEWDMQVVISDYRMPGMNGVDFLREVHEGWPDTIRIVLSGFADTPSVVAAINEGQIYKFIAKPWNDEELKATIEKAVDTYRLKKKNDELARQLQASIVELKMHNEDLERLVENRTAELVFQNSVLRESRNILDFLPVGVLGLDNAGFIVQGNRYFYDLTGQPAGSIAGKDVTEVLPEEIVEFIDGIPHEEVKMGKFLILGNPYQVKGVRMKTDDGQEGVVLVIYEEAVS